MRWEYRPGSTLFVAWTQQREDTLDPGNLEFSRDLGRLLQAPGDDILLVKLSWRLGALSAGVRWPTRPPLR